MDDLFSVPLGHVTPSEPEESVGMGPVPPEAAEHRGKWLALEAGRIIAVRDSPAELRNEFAGQHLGITFFHVPTSELIAR